MFLDISDTAVTFAAYMLFAVFDFYCVFTKLHYILRLMSARARRADGFCDFRLKQEAATNAVRITRVAAAVIATVVAVVKVVTPRRCR